MNKKNTDIEELRMYREAKSSNRLFIVPEGMNDGDIVWHISHINDRVSSHMIIEWVIVTGRLFGKIAVDDSILLFSPEDIGVVIFRTKEEAENALEAWKEALLIAEEVGVNTEEDEEIVSDNRQNL